MLKVSPWKGVIHFGKKGKLALRYVGPFEILERIGSVAYRLRLPEELSRIHDTFHVSNLKKYLADASLHVPLDEIKVDKTLRFVEEPVEILNREVKSLKRSKIALVKIVREVLRSFVGSFLEAKHQVSIMRLGEVARERLLGLHGSSLLYLLCLHEPLEQEWNFHRGLRQGDPLSPFLFILVMENLHVAFQRVIERGMFNPIIIGKDARASNPHLFYVDDAMFIGKWSTYNVNVLVMMLHCFFLASGLKINVNKSGHYGVGVHSSDVQMMADSFGCLANSLPFTYLGVKVGANMDRINAWQDVIQKVPDGVLNQIEGLRNSFFLGEDSEERKKTWVFGLMLLKLFMVPMVVLISRPLLIKAARFGLRSIKRLPNLKPKESILWNIVKRRLRGVSKNVNDRSFLNFYLIVSSDNDVGLVPMNNKWWISFSVKSQGKCIDDVESRNHIFSGCSLASDLFKLMRRWWNIHIPSLPYPLAWERYDEDDKSKDETCLVAHASSEVCSESSYFSDENSSIDDIALDNEYDKLKTPYEILRGRKPTLDYFRVFGSKCFILNTKDYLTKFDPKSYEGVFLGYSQNSKAYIILNKHTRKIEESLNVTFDETPPPAKTSPLVDDDLDEEEAIREIKKKNLENNVEDETLEIDEVVNIKESRNHPLENVIGNLNQRTLRSQAQNQSNFYCFISTIEPKNVNEALGDKSWIVAMQEELNQFIANDVWELVPQPKNMTVIGTKWVFRNKLDENVVLSSANDRWSWSLNRNGVFSVKSAREVIDKHLLIISPSPTRWSKLIPIKLNIFAWRMFLDKLPTRVNLSNKGIDIPCVLCLVCGSDVESRNHIFYGCSLASDLFKLMGRWWNIHIPSLPYPLAWEVWFDGWCLNSLQRSVLEATFFSLWWHIWNFRNAVLFSSENPKKSLIFDNVVSQSWLWVNYRSRKANVFWLAWLIDPSNAISPIDCTGGVGISILMKCTSTFHQLAYDSVPDALDKYLQMGVKTSRDALQAFYKVVMDLYGGELADYPNAYGAQYCRGDHEPHPFILLEALASQDLWIWHAFFSVSEVNNDVNVISQSPIFNDLKDGKAPKNCLWPYTNDTKRIRYKQAHEATRNYAELAFDVLKRNGL
ncbi:retrovirus-related pol polyprotein from transposon TNT 1-94 [Tanacetum coccineum]|uniref:Retrovirus-related pol polyprotein from transposon TNT 1-94 n=1 Tax=Tanacetum coccineum TaxID=301880 RepID=A0ABQ5EQS3_9ASTR